jgi:GTP-binding protein Era
VLGEKVAIVTAKPQTTRSRILGIHSLEHAQICFLDTPGLHSGQKLLNTVLNDQIDEAARDCDVALVLSDLTSAWGEDHDALMAALAKRRTPALVVGTKLDLRGAADTPWPPRSAERAFRVSAQSGEGVPELLDAIIECLPESPPLYPDSDLSDRPIRFLAAELVREAAFEELAQELPYSLAVEVIEFDESRAGLVKIRANLLVERQSQKQIVIGRGGSVIKRIGIVARSGIEDLVGSQVHLALWVKVEPRWMKRPERIKSLGYD